MANRVLLGNHSTYGYGLYVSKPGIDVTGANRDDFLFDSKNSAQQGQIIHIQRESISSGASTSRSFYSYGSNCYGAFFWDNEAHYRIPKNLSNKTLSSKSIANGTGSPPIGLTIEEVDSDTAKYTLKNNTDSTEVVTVIVWRSEIG